MRVPIAVACCAALAAGTVACGSDEEKSGPGGKERRGATTARTTATAATATATATTRRRPAAPPRCRRVAAPRPKPMRREPRPTLRLDRKRAYDAIVDTNCGRFTIALDVRESPRTAGSFVHLARRGFFDRTTFHRIVPGFVIQGGDPQGSGQGGPGYSVVEPPPPGTRYTKGTVAMAKTEIDDPGTSGSQFYVVTDDVAPLPPHYALLGRVTSGLDVVELIGTQPIDAANPDPNLRERPVDPVVIRSVRIVERRR